MRRLANAIPDGPAPRSPRVRLRLRAPALAFALAPVLALNGGCSRCGGGEPAALSNADGRDGGPEAHETPGSGDTARPAPTKAATASADTAAGRPDFDAARRPHARVDSVTASGGVTEETARSAARTLEGAADACVATRLAEKPGLRGTVRVDVKLSPAPAPPAVTAAHTGEDGPLQDCLQRAYAAWPAGARPAVGDAAIVLSITVYSGLRLPTTRPSLPPPPALPPLEAR